MELRKTISSFVLAAMLLVQIQSGLIGTFEPLLQKTQAAGPPLGSASYTPNSYDSQTNENGSSVTRPSGGTLNCPSGQVITSVAYLGIQAGNDSTDGLTIACSPINATNGTLGTQGAYLSNSDLSSNTRFPSDLVQPTCGTNNAVATVYWADLESNASGGRQDAMDGQGIGCNPISCDGIDPTEVDTRQPGDFLPHGSQVPTTIQSISCPTGSVAVGIVYDSFGSQVSSDPDATDSVVKLRCAPVSNSFCAVPGADLSITKSGPSSVIQGGVVSYTLTALNAGPATANSVTFTDAIPSGLTFNASQSSGNCIQSGSNIVCNNITLGSGQSTSVTVSFNVPNSVSCNSNIQNTASISTSTTDPNSSNNQSGTVSTTVTCPVQADLSIQKSGPSSVQRGNVAIYTVTVTNNGPATASNVTVTDAIPSGLTFNASQSSNSCFQSGNNVVCNNFSLSNGQTTNIQIAFNVPTVANCTQTTVNNTATVSSATTDPVSGNNTSQTVQTTLTCPPVTADLSIQKFGPSSIERGNVLSYTVSVTNNGPSTVSSITITDAIPSGLTFNASQSSNSCVQNGSNVVCTLLFNLSSNQSTNIQIAFNVPTVANCTQTTVNNTATVSSPISDPVSGNNTSQTVQTTLTCPPVTADLSIIKNGPATVLQGGIVSYTLTATNNGPNTANNVTIADPIPGGLTFNASQSSGNCVQNGSNILCNNLTLTNGQSATVTVSFNVPNSVFCNSSIFNTSSVSTSTTDPNSSNNQSSTVSTTVTCNQADLWIVKNGPATVAQGGIVSYTLTATNNGPNTANNVTIADPIPAGLTFNPSQTSGNCVQNGSNILCNNLTLTNGQSATVTVSFNVPNFVSCNSTIFNTSSVSTSTTDPNSSNNQSGTVSTTVTCPVQADLSIQKSGPSSVQRGNVAIYTVTVSNNGPATANNVTVTDAIPSGLTFNPSQSSNSCFQSGNNVVCNNFSLSNGQTTNIQIAFNVPTVANCTQTTVNNTATVSSATTDPVLGNNTSQTVQTTLTCPPVTADLSVVKSGPATVVQGGVVIYTVSAFNGGPNTANNVTIADPIPAGLTFNPSQSSANCLQNGVNILCNNLTLTNGQSATVTIAFNVPNTVACSSTILNSASVSTSTTDPNSANNQSSTVSTSVTCAPVTADLSIQKIGPSSIVRGSTIVYTLNIFNAGPGTATNVVITDPIPAGLTFNVAQSSNSCAINGSNIVCSNFNLTSGQNAVLPIAFDVPNIANCVQVSVSNTASITSSTTDPNLSNNQSQTVTTALECPITAGADLSISKTGPSTIVRGGVVQYTLTALNAGPGTGTNIAFTDPIPAGLTFNASQSSGNCVQSSNNIVCNSLTLGSGQSASVTVSFNVPNTLTCNSTIANIASVSTSATDPNLSNNQSQTVTTTVTCPPVTTADMAIQKTGTLTAVRGSNVIYTITVTNLGPATATGVVITDPIPANLTYSSFTASSGVTCVATTTQIQCQAGTLAINQSATITLTFTAQTVTSCTQTITTTNIASVSAATTDPNTTNNQGQATTTLTCPTNTVADLSVALTGSTTVQRGTNAIYTATVINNGPSTASAATMTLPTPSGLTYSSASGATCAVSGSNVNCTLGTMTTGQSITVVFTFAAPTISNCTQTTVQAVTTVASSTTDPALANNTSQTVSTILTCPNTGGSLTIYKTDNRSTASVGDTLNYQITLTNSSSTATTNVTVSDSVPYGLTILTVSNGGSISGQNVTWTNLTVPANGSLTITLNAQIRSDVSNNTVLRNTASVNGQTSTDDTTVQGQTYQPPYYPPYQPPHYPPYFPPTYTPTTPPVFYPPVVTQPTPPPYYPPVILPQTGTNDDGFYSNPIEKSSLTPVKKGQQNNANNEDSGGFTAIVYATLIGLLAAASAAASKFLTLGL